MVEKNQTAFKIHIRRRQSDAARGRCFDGRARGRGDINAVMRAARLAIVKTPRPINAGDASGHRPDKRLGKPASHGEFAARFAFAGGFSFYFRQRLGRRRHKSRRQPVNALLDICARREFEINRAGGFPTGEKHALIEGRIAPEAQHNLVFILRQGAPVIKRARIRLQGHYHQPALGQRAAHGFYKFFGKYPSFAKHLCRGIVRKSAQHSEKRHQTN